MTTKHQVKLTDGEILLLDSIERLEIRAIVAAARSRIESVGAYPGLTPERAAFIADVLIEAREAGILIRQWKQIRSCSVCGASGEYRLPSKRHKKERFFEISGVELAKRFISMKGYTAVGCCSACFESVEAHLIEALQGVPVEIPECWEAAPHRWKRYDKRHCTKCEWTGHEGEMRQLPAIMRGTYPGGCPNCDAENSAFGLRLIERADGFVMVELPEWRPHAEKADAWEGWLDGNSVGHYVKESRGSWEVNRAVRPDGTEREFRTHFEGAEKKAREWLTDGASQ